MKTKLTFIFTLLATSLAFAQTAYRTVASGNWNAITTWERYNSGTWAPAGVGQIPGALDSVYIQTGHTVTLTQNESCGDLNLHNASGVRVALNDFALNVNGKIAAFNSAAGVFPVTYSTGSFSASFSAGTTSSGLVRFVGNTRDITKAGQWTANPQYWPVEFALNAGATGTFNTGFKAGKIRIVSGIIACQDLRPDSGSNKGTLVIESGATLRTTGTLARTGTATAQFESITVNGVLELAGTSTTQALSAITLNVGAGGVIKKINPNALSTSSTITNINWANGSMLEYAGTANQTVGAEFPAGIAIPKVRINNTATGGTVTFPATRTIRDTLVMTEGNIVVASTDSLILGTSATAVLQRTTGSVIGKLNRYISASTTGNVLFPVGTVSAYRPVNANFVSAPLVAGNISIAHVDNGVNYTPITSYTDGSYTVDRVSESYWTGSVNAGFTATNIALSCDLSGQAGIANASETRITGSSDGGTTYGAPGGTHSAGTGTTAFRTSFQVQAPLSFNLYLGGNSSTNPLPVSLQSLTATRTPDGNVISWVTATESNNNMFYVERSLNNGRFEVIGTVKGAGNSSKSISYSFTDADAGKAGACYRLNQVDFDGNSTISKTVCVVADQSKQPVSTTPNPFNDRLEVVYNAATHTNVSVEVIDLLGKVHYSNTESVNDGSNTFRVNTASLPAGVYFVRITNGTDVSTQRIIKK